jgi:voltage-gated potassium channel
MFENKHLLRQLIAMFLITIIGGTIGYTLVEDGWSYFDGFYMTLITLTTIGFGEVHTMTTGGRILTVLIIVFGLGTAATILTQVAQMFLQGDIADAWRNHRMDKRIGKLKDHVIICGFGRIGQAICRDLTDMGVDCVVIDRDDKRADSARGLDIPTLAGNGTADHALLSAGIEQASVLVAALSNDSDNLFVALAARDLNPGLKVIARGEDKSIETRMLRAGVDQVVYPAQLGGGQIARLIGAELGHDDDSVLRNRASDVLGYDLQVFRSFAKDGSTVAQILEKTGALKAVAHVDGNGFRHPDPEDDRVVKEGEALVLIQDIISTSNSDGTEALEGLPRNLSVGIPSIDEEHQNILAMVRKLGSADQKMKKTVVHEILNDLRDYTVKHFKREESLFLAAGYPGADDHVAEHRNLTAKVDELLTDRQQISSDSLGELLDSWIRDHILVCDKKYINHLNQKQEAVQEETACPR